MSMKPPPPIFPALGKVAVNAKPTATEASSLGVQDLQNCAQIIDIAMSRGAFRANEAAQVGAVYNKIDAFIKSVAETQNQNAEASASQ